MGKLIVMDSLLGCAATTLAQHGCMAATRATIIILGKIPTCYEYWVFMIRSPYCSTRSGGGDAIRSVVGLLAKCSATLSLRYHLLKYTWAGAYEYFPRRVESKVPQKSYCIESQRRCHVNEIVTDV